MKLKDNLFLLAFVFYLAACEHSDLPSKDHITIYYENDDIDDSGYDYPDFSNIEKINPSLFRDEGLKKVDSSLFYSFCRNLAAARYTKNKEKSLNWSGDYKMFIDIKSRFSDSLILNKNNVYYSISRQRGAQLDSLSYVIRNAIDYFNIFEVEALHQFKDFKNYERGINYSYESINGNSVAPTLYTKIILIPDSQ